MIKLYYKLENLPDEVKKANKIRSKARLDCTKYTDLLGNYKGLINFVNKKNQLNFYLTPARDFVSCESKRIAEYSLTGGGLNFTSLYIEDLDMPYFAYGTANANKKLANGEENPMFAYRMDGYLFIINPDYTIIELFIIPNGRNLISSYYQKLLDGGFDDEIDNLRKIAKPFFDYWSAI